MLSVDIRRRLGAFQLDAKFSSAAPLLSLFGRSGSGKTSIINAIAGASRPDTGTIAFDDAVFFDAAKNIWMPPELRRVGYVFQDGLLFPHLSVKDNLHYARSPVPAKKMLIDSAGVIELLGLGSLLHRRPAALSGGEKQRVAIGRALLAQPRLLLLDEPLASLDSDRKAEILTYIERLRDHFAIPIVFVSHSLDEVVRLADEMVLIERGLVVATGSVTEITSHPEWMPAAGRFDAGTVIETHVESHDAHYGLTTLTFPGGELIVPHVGATAGERVRVRILARDVSLATSEPRDVSIHNVLQGTITEILGDGDSGAVADVRIAIGESTLVARVTRRSIDRLLLARGQPVFALVKAISLDRRGA
ncbi:MAG: molybdenum ABC transporter ATP-binding protein [Betaproteobacteria bacterium]